MLKSSRIQLVKITESDISQEYLDNLNDVFYLKFSRNSKIAHTSTTQAQYISEINSSNNLFFGISSYAENKLIGTVNCYINFNTMTLNLGILVFKNYANQGYATEALKILVSYLNQEFPGMTMVIGLSKSNMGMQKVARNLNFEVSPALDDVDCSYIKFVRKIPIMNYLNSPYVPQFILNAKKIGVAANDAGGAEQIVWLLKNLECYASAYISGPAIKIFNQGQINFNKISNLEFLNDFDLIITGSGWMTDLEKETIKFANQRSIPCITILDNWVNYLARFGENQLFYPNILAVTNCQALLMAQKIFPNKLVWHLPDFQLKYYQNLISKDDTDSKNLLVIAEPTMIENELSNVSIEDFERLITSAISIKTEENLEKVFVRPHPSQEDNILFDQILEKFSEEIEVLNNTALIDDLKNSKIVIGINSYVLYIAALSGIKTYSLFSGKNYHWTNLFSQISSIPELP